MTREEIIKRSKDMHGDKFDYSLVFDTKRRDKIKIICPVHGEFEQFVGNHISGRGCRLCENDSRRKDINSVIDDLNKKHNFKYKYIINNYRNNKDLIEIICPIHGKFKQKVITHLNGFGCPDCGGSKKLTNVDFIERSKKIHSDFYKYNKCKYINNETPVTITCPLHGDFKMSPHTHLRNGRCPECRISIGERKIKKYLDENNINYIAQAKFDNLVNRKQLRFDFYLPHYNICIEFDGRQHFSPISYFGGDEGYKILKLRDKIKTDYCLDNKIKLIRISSFSEIESILKNEI